MSFFLYHLYPTVFWVIKSWYFSCYIESCKWEYTGCTPYHLLYAKFSDFSHHSLFMISLLSNVSQFSCSVVSDSVTPWIAACQASLSIISSQSSLKLMSIELMMPSNHLILCHPLFLLPSIFSCTRVFSNESALPIRRPKYCSFSFNMSPSNEHSGLISFRMDRLDLLAVQGILKSLLQHHSSKTSILWHLAFFIVQMSYPYTTTGKTTALTRQTFVDKVTSLLFDMLSRLVITFLPRSKHLLISWLQWPSAVILEITGTAKKRKIGKENSSSSKNTVNKNNNY